MATIEEFIQNNLGRPNMTPKVLILEAYAIGVAHGKGEEYEPAVFVVDVLKEEEEEVEGEEEGQSKDG